MSATARAITCAVVLATASAAGSQVVPIGGGNALDANMGVGSGGVNSPVAPDLRLNGQLYINGQVTGLGRFHGRVGYFPSDQLRLQLPSAGLVGFRRESVGLSNVLSGPTYTARPYYDRSVTALNAGAIAAGLNAPGTNVPPSALGSPQARQLYEELAAEYRSVSTSQTVVPSLAPSASVVGTGHAPSVGGMDRGERAGPGGPVTDEFGRSRLEDEDALAHDLWQFQRLNRPMDERLNLRIETLLDRPGEKNPDEIGRTAPPAEERGEPSGAVGRAGRGEPALPGTNADAFLDVMAALRRRREETKTTLTVPQAATTRPAARIVEADAAGVVIHSLAGLGQGLFNLHMARGQERLKAGRYYDALDEFHLAAVAEPRNPLALVGMCVARLGAGEPAAAGEMLYGAMRLFPPLMETRLDLLRLVDSRMIEQRMAELDSLLQEDKDDAHPKLVLLAAYARHSLGQEFLAKTAAAKLRRSAGGDKLLLAVAEFLLTGRRAGRDAQAAPERSATTAPAR